MITKRSLILVRHAHRDKSQGRELDNDLSAKGQKQAKRVREFFFARFGQRKARFLSSPKKRCVETLEPTAKKLKLSIEISKLLDEGGDVRGKCQRFLNQINRSSDELIVICSHGDWIPEFIQLCFGTTVELDKGGWIEIEIRAGSPSLTWIVQNFEDF